MERGSFRLAVILTTHHLNFARLYNDLLWLVSLPCLRGVLRLKYRHINSATSALAAHRPRFGSVRNRLLVFLGPPGQSINSYQGPTEPEAVHSSGAERALLLYICFHSARDGKNQYTYIRDDPEHP